MAKDGADVRESLYQLQERQRAALRAGDLDALSQLLSDDFQQVHAHGLIEDKAAFLASARSYPGTAESAPPEITLHGDVALMRGISVRRVTVDGIDREFRIFVSRIAARQDGAWRYVHIQATMMPEA